MIGIVLAGGKSRRFGEQKALYELDGKPFYEHVYNVLKEVERIDTVVISSNAYLASTFHKKVIVDHTEYSDYGPLAGIYSVMKEMESDSYFVVAVDHPYITTEAVNHLIDAYEGQLTLYKEKDRIHATIGIYPYTEMTRIESLLKNKRLALRGLFDEQTKYIDVTNVYGQWYRNVNYKTDLLERCEADDCYRSTESSD